MGNEEMRVNNTPAVTDEEQEDATIEQEKLINHEPVPEEPGNPSDPNQTQGELRNDRRSQDTDTVSSCSSLSGRRTKVACTSD